MDILCALEGVFTFVSAGFSSCSLAFIVIWSPYFSKGGVHSDPHLQFGVVTLLEMQNLEPYLIRRYILVRSSAD